MHLSKKVTLAAMFAFIFFFLTINNAKAQYANPDDSLALVDIYKANYNSNTSNSYWNWLRPPYLVRSWSGVTLDKDGFVVGLHVDLLKFTPAIGRLTHLQTAQLGGPYLSDSIPSFIGDLVNLTSLVFSYCSGSIPSAIGKLTRLTNLKFYICRFTGSIPSDIGSLTQLTRLDLSQNKLTGLIPDAIGNMTSLDTLDLSDNQLTGSLPATIGNLSHLKFFNVHLNNLTGSIPETLGNCTALIHLDCYGNQLTGAIPAAIGNLTQMDWLDLSFNRLTGSVPLSIGNATSLYECSLSYNQLSGPLPSTIGNLTMVVQLDCRYNQLSGPLPATICNMSSLQELFLQDNQITGPLPSGIGNLVKLTQLVFDHNQFSGSIPTSIGSLVNLTNLDFSNNLFSGSIPPTLGNLTNLMGLNLVSTIGGGQFTDTLPASLGNLVNLSGLYISNNKLTGKIPSILGNLVNLTNLYLDNNGLTGPIPGSLYNLNKLTTLQLQKNQLTDTISSNISHLSSLTWLNIGFNKLTGKIPASIGQLTQLTWLDLSYNQFSGVIPAAMDNLVKLTSLNLQNNRLGGRVPSLSHLAASTNITITNNQFTFDGMEELATTFGIRASYSLQARVHLIQTGDTLKMPARGTLANNTYYWEEIGGPGYVISSDSTYFPVSAGKYTVYVQNKVAWMLTLYSDTIDYSPPLVVNMYDAAVLARTDGFLFTNLDRIDPTRTVQGAATDGVTKILLLASSGKPLRFMLPDNTPGSLTPIDLQLVHVRDTTINPNNDQVAIIYNVPDGYGRSSPLPGRDIRIKAGYADNPDSTIDVVVHLVPPPVVMVHGMWSSPDVWKDFKPHLVQAGFDAKSIFLADYSKYASHTFNPNSSQSRYGRDAVQAQITAALDYFHQQRLAVTQVDIVAHSLGGLMTRSLSQQPGFIGATNYGKGPIHKLITLGTPHRGSPLGLELWKNQANLILIHKRFLTVADFMQWQNMPIGSCHLDFGVNSPGILALKKTPPFQSYAITASYHGDEQTPTEFAGYYAMKTLVNLIGGQPYDSLFASRCHLSTPLDNDLIVPLSSQSGYILATKRFTGTGHSFPADTTETNSVPIQEQVTSLLVSNDTTLFSRGFPALSDLGLDCQTTVQDISISESAPPYATMPETVKTVPLGNPPPDGQNAASMPDTSKYIQIISPSGGTRYQQNSHTTIHFAYKTSGNPEISQAAVFIQGGGWYTLPDRTTTLDISLPDNTPSGILSLALLAKDSAGHLLGDTTSVVMTPAGTLDSLLISPSTLTLDSAIRTGVCYVQGYYSGSQRVYTTDLSASLTGTRYSFIHGKTVASVSPDGLVTGLQPGIDTLIITNNGITCRLPVTVKDSIKKASLYPNQITLQPIPDKKLTDFLVALQATASSGETVTFAVTGPATLNSSILTLSGVGKVTVTASQAGNAYFASAPDQTLSFCVMPPDTPVIQLKNNNLISSIASDNQWYLDGSPIQGATDSVYHPEKGGNYTVRTITQGCQGPLSQPFNYTITAATGPLSPDNDLKIYPNPVSDGVTIDYPPGRPYSLVVYSLAGQSLLTVKDITGKYLLFMGSEPAGCYILEVIDNLNHIKQRRLLLKK